MLYINNRYARLMSMTFYEVYQNHLNIGMFMANQKRWVIQLFCNTCFILTYRDQFYIKADGTNFYFTLFFSNVRSLNRGFFFISGKCIKFKATKHGNKHILLVVLRIPILWRQIANCQTNMIYREIAKRNQLLLNSNVGLSVIG